MAEEIRLAEEATEPAGELIHLPGPSYLPVLTALGVTLAISGVVLSLAMVILGGALALFCVIRWIREARREMSELPLEH